MELSAKQNHFRDRYGNFSDKEMMIELLMSQSIQIEKLERVRSNLNKLVWFLIVIPIVMMLFSLFFLGSMTALL